MRHINIRKHSTSDSSHILHLLANPISLNLPAPSLGMPRGTICSYYDCGQGLLVLGRPLSKAQKNHVVAYHTDQPITFICRHTDQPTTFNRQIAKGMDFVCYCGSTFTLNSSLQRHYQLCKVAKNTALEALKKTAQVDGSVPRQEKDVSLRLSDSTGGISSASTSSFGASRGGTSNGGTSNGGTSSSSTSSDGTSCGDVIVSRAPTSMALVAEPTIGQLLEQKMIERHQVFLESFTEHTTAQHAKFMASMTENHMTFLQAFTTAQVQQSTDLQSTLAEQHRKAFEQQRIYLDIQQKRQEELMYEQKLTRDTVKSLLSTKREGSFTLEVDEQALKRIQNDPVYVVRPH
ncbi:hypothetical protein F5H01DRAFT_358357 [Linnemannia elongata]|nr:hypothetical protein F5H01DRAFT_358357 [Linnemannia elongata]